jgi:hypothetical protein
MRKRKLKLKLKRIPSFFDFFNHFFSFKHKTKPKSLKYKEKIRDYNTGVFIKNKLIPDSLLYFLNKKRDNVSDLESESDSSYEYSENDTDDYLF